MVEIREVVQSTRDNIVESFEQFLQLSYIVYFRLQLGMQIL